MELAKLAFNCRMSHRSTGPVRAGSVKDRARSYDRQQKEPTSVPSSRIASPACNIRRSSSNVQVGNNKGFATYYKKPPAKEEHKVYQPPPPIKTKHQKQLEVQDKVLQRWFKEAADKQKEQQNVEPNRIYSFMEVLFLIFVFL